MQPHNSKTVPPDSMSTSRDQNAVPLPPLPPELWWHIIQLATAVPRLFDTDIADPFGPASPGVRNLWDTTHEQNAVIAAQRTKCALVRVCRAFHTLAMPLLYEALYIGHEDALAPLRRTLVRSQDQSARPLGAYARRLDIALPATHFDLELEFAECRGRTVADVVRCLPRLEIFSALWTALDLERTHASDMIAAALDTACRGTLRRIAWPHPAREGPYVVFTSYYRMFASSAPRLRTLLSDGRPQCCAFDGALPRTLAFMTVPLCAPRYHDCRRAAAPSAPYPALTQIAIRDPVAADMRCLARFLAVQGPLLTTVHLSFGFDGAIGELFAALHGSCPNLRHVVLVLGWWPRFALPLGVRLPALTHLGLYLPDRGLGREHYEIFKWVRAMVAPALRVVRFMNPKHLEDLRVWNTQVWVEAMQDLSGRQLRFEDPEGRCLDPGE